MIITVLNVVTGRCNEIHTLMMPRITQHFTIKFGTMSIGKHSDTDFLQTQDCILLWTADVDLLVKLRGMMRIKV